MAWHKFIWYELYTFSSNSKFCSHINAYVFQAYDPVLRLENEGAKSMNQCLLVSTKDRVRDWPKQLWNPHPVGLLWPKAHTRAVVWTQRSWLIAENLDSNNIKNNQHIDLCNNRSTSTSKSWRTYSRKSRILSVEWPSRGWELRLQERFTVIEYRIPLCRDRERIISGNCSLKSSVKWWLVRPDIYYMILWDRRSVLKTNIAI